MVKLLDFPDELLLQIVDETLPDGIEALARSSPRLRILAKDALIQHEADKKRCHNIEINEDEGPGPLLIEMIRNPRRRYYPQHVNFEYCREDVYFPLEEDIGDNLTQTLVQQPCVPLTELPHWVQEAASGNQDIIIAILLLLLPNLTTLIIPSTRYCESVIRRIIEWSQQSVIPQPNLPLARLENVVIGDDLWNTFRPGEFLIEHGLEIFRGLPSLRSLLCLYRTDRALYNPSISLHFCDGCTQMHICDYELSSEDLELILQHVENLTVFTYIDRFASNVARYLDDILERYAGDSLQELKLQCLPNKMSMLPSHGFDNLTGFTVLKKVMITLDTFHNEWNRSWSRPTLVDFLPSSVEEILVVGQTTCHNAEKVLDELAYAKAVHFPGLKKVQMTKTQYFTASEMWVASEKAGITLELDHRASDMDILEGETSQ